MGAVRYYYFNFFMTDTLVLDRYSECTNFSGYSISIFIFSDILVAIYKSDETIINPRRTCAARVTVLGLSFCLSVCLSVCLSATLFWQYAQLKV